MIIGYFAVVLIGATLGIIGAGGSILTVPVLVYLFQIDAHVATSYSLFIVGTAALFGTAGYLKREMVDYRSAILFGIPSVISIFITRKYILPSIPQQIFIFNDKVFTKDTAIMLLLAILMILASYSMIKKKKKYDTNLPIPKTASLIAFFFQGIIVGLTAGLIGAGGGFLIIPALVMFGKLRMKTAIGTSLMIITLNSFIGFSGDLHNHLPLNWNFLLFISLCSIIGMIAGVIVSKNISGEKLKPAFGIFILLMGIFIFVQELLM